MKKLLISAAVLILCLPAHSDPVLITTAVPIEKLDGDGHPCGVSMAQPGAAYTLVSQQGDNVVIKDASGNQYLISIQATNYSPPAAPSAGQPAAATNAASTSAPPASIPAPAPASPAPPVSAADTTPASPPAAPALSSEAADKIKQINDALGLPLLADAQFWQENVEQVAQRLGWPEESKTKTEESYRRYADAGEVTVLGASAYSLALYGKMGHPTYISLVFANAGDFAEARKQNHSHDVEAIEAAREDLGRAVKKDAESITSDLTSILGDPTITSYGNAASNRDEVHRWDWNDVAILLNSHEGEYASVKIVPTTVADNYGTVDVTDRDEMRSLLAGRVVKRDNGDVVLSELPMVDQGPKGYCVPATWERYLRYMDVPADLYVLAIMGGAGLGGGTSTAAMQAGVDGYVTAYHRRIEIYDAPLDVIHIQKYIDQGLPLMWTCWVVKPVEIQASKNTLERQTVADWTAYTKSLADEDAALGDLVAPNSDRTNGHMRLIIGYNANTNEIAISDSWGPAAAERWMYAPTALKISQGQLSYLSW
jgi:hypothetical protein